jgi:hypothetical protein
MVVALLSGDGVAGGKWQQQIDWIQKLQDLSQRTPRGGGTLKQARTSIVFSNLQGRQPGSEVLSLTAEQLEASRAERMRHNGHGTLNLDEARTWIEETGFCLFLPRRQYSLSIAPSLVEAIAGQRNPAPDPKHTAVSEDLLVRLENESIAVRLNLLGQVGEQPDFVVAAWVLPYVYALRGDRDWRRSPQLTGSRQVSPLAVQAYKQLEAGDATISELRHALGREVSESAVLRAITELWQQLRIIPVLSAPGKAPKWQLLRTRYQKAIAEGASTSQVTAISVLASIYLQAVIAATMEEVELFLAPLTARSKIREVLRGLVATRQVHTISLGHAPHFYVAGTLPEFVVPQTAYASTAMPASAYFMHAFERDEEARESFVQKPAVSEPLTPKSPARGGEPHISVNASASPKHPAPRPHASRSSSHSHDRKPAQPSASRPARRAASDSRWGSNGAKSSNGKRNSGHGSNGSSNGARQSNGAKSAGSAWTKPNGHSNGAKPTVKTGTAARKEVRPTRTSRKPVVPRAKTSAGKRFGFSARAKQGTKKRG